VSLGDSNGRFQKHTLFFSELLLFPEPCNASNTRQFVSFCL